MAKSHLQANGKYRYWYNGKQFWGNTDAEAKRKRDEYKYECEHGIEKPEPITSTYNQYATIMEKMTETIGDKIVSAVSPSDIKAVWTKYVGKSQSYINKASFLYKSFFQYAMENRYCSFNPVESASAKPHRGSKGSHRALTKEEISLIETVPHRVQCAAIFMLKAGLRRGEVLALTKDDIYDDKIHVVKAVKFINNRPVVGQTKNESSERTVPLFSPLIPFISFETEYCLSDANGELCSETAFQRAWESYLKTLSDVAGHPISFRPHDLRHTFVTWGRNKGIDLRTMMGWCGHSSERMILQIYDHPSEEREQRMASMMYD